MFILWSTADFCGKPKFFTYLGLDHFSPAITELQFVVLNMLPSFFLFVTEI